MKALMGLVLGLALSVGVASAQEQTVDATASTPASVSGDGSTATGKTTETVSAPSAWGFEYLGEVVGGLDGNNGNIQLDNYLHFNYAHTKDVKSTIRLLFSNELYGRQNGIEADTNSFIPGQHLYQISHGNLFTAATLKGTGYVRFYFPTSEASLTEGKEVLRVRPRLNVGRDFGPLNVSLSDMADLYARRDFVFERNAVRNFLFNTLKLSGPAGLSLYTVNYLLSYITTEGNGFNEYAHEAGISYDFLERFNVTAYVDSRVRTDQLSTLYTAPTTTGYFDFSAAF